MATSLVTLFFNGMIQFNEQLPLKKFIKQLESAFVVKMDLVNLTSN